jgi:hypothetical protein
VFKLEGNLIFVVGAGGLGLSSGSTAIPFVSLDSDDVSGSSSFSPPSSPNGYSCSNTSPMRSFTLASGTVMTKISDLIKHEGSYLVEKSRQFLKLRKMMESSWDIRENDEAFLHMAMDSTTYYIRPCYREVYSVLDEMFRGKKDVGNLERCTCALITGTPGIGKSVFGLVLIKLIMQRPKPTLILYNPAFSKRMEIFWQGRCFVATEEKAWDFVSNIMEDGDLISMTSHDHDMIEIWYISDARVPIHNEYIKEVCISSPRRANSSQASYYEIKTWAKNTRAITLALPPCEWSEMLNIRLALWKEEADKKCPLETLEKEYKFWGGVPRTLIEKPASLENLRSKFRQLKIADALPPLGTYNLDHIKVSESFFHLLPAFKMLETDSKLSLNEKYSNPTYWWATESMAQQAWSQFCHEQEATVISYIEMLNNVPGARGRSIEEVYHLVEVAGIRWSLRNL